MNETEAKESEPIYSNQKIIIRSFKYCHINFSSALVRVILVFN